MDVWEVPCSSCSVLDKGFLMDVGPPYARVCSITQRHPLLLWRIAGGGGRGRWSGTRSGRRPGRRRRRRRRSCIDPVAGENAAGGGGGRDGRSRGGHGKPRRGFVVLGDRDTFQATTAPTACMDFFGLCAPSVMQ